MIVLQRETALRLATGGRFARRLGAVVRAARRGRIPPRAFRPVPSVESALLTIVPRAVPLLSPAAFAGDDHGRAIADIDAKGQHALGELAAGEPRDAVAARQRGLGERAAEAAAGAGDEPCSGHDRHDTRRTVSYQIAMLVS